MNPYKISYAVFSITGNRANNEDNFLCCGRMENAVHGDLDEILTGETESARPQVFAVFDGLGGESAGEMASFLAAEFFGRQMENVKSPNNEDSSKKIHKEGIEEMYLQANDCLVTYMKEKQISTMGTTVAMVICNGDSVWISNIGDSRIYSIHEDHIAQLSVDHVMGRAYGGKSPLSQCLGIPAEEFIISPEIYRKKPEKNMYFLLCSDGVSDCLYQRELLKIINRDNSMTDKLEQMKEKISNSANPDNATAILLRFQEMD